MVAQLMKPLDYVSAMVAWRRYFVAYIRTQYFSKIPGCLRMYPGGFVTLFIILTTTRDFMRGATNTIVLFCKLLQLGLTMGKSIAPLLEHTMSS